MLTLVNTFCFKRILKENNSSHSIPQNAGSGLDTINSFVKTNKGAWKLLSGDALLTGNTGKNNYSKNIVTGLKGTLFVQIKNITRSEAEILKKYSAGFRNMQTLAEIVFSFTCLS